MQEIKKILSEINKASTGFGGSLNAIEQKMFSEVISLTKELETSNGKIKNSNENFKIILSIRKKLDDVILNDSGYVDDMQKLTKSYDTILNAQMDYFYTLSNKVNKERFETVKKIAMLNTVDALTGAGLQANVTNQINEMLLQSVASGTTYKDMTERMREFLTQTENGDGALTRYARTYAETAVNQYAGQNIKLLTDDLGLEWYMYVGSEKTTTRQFCSLMLDKKYIHKSEIRTVLSGNIDGHRCELYDKTGLPKGMIEGTTPENFPVLCGGWNCGHKMIPISDAIVPIPIKSKIK